MYLSRDLSNSLLDTFLVANPHLELMGEGGGVLFCLSC